MKRTTPNKLRARSLDPVSLEKAHGGRGTLHGYWQCIYCGTTAPGTAWYCPNCGRNFDPVGGQGGRK